MTQQPIPLRLAFLLRVRTWTLFGMILTGTAGFWVAQRKVTVYDTHAQRTYASVKRYLQSQKAEAESPFRLIARRYTKHDRSHEALGNHIPFHHIVVDVFQEVEDARGTRSLTQLMVHHPQGAHTYTYLEVNGLETEQTIQR